VSFEKELEKLEIRLSDPRRTRPTDEADFEKMQVDLQGPPFPEGTLTLYGHFVSLSGGRSSNGFGPNALSAVEILAWCQLTGHRLSAWDFETVRALDARWLSVYAELHKPDDNKK
jgi:hypothetical protein